jgi:hypothetical protein
LAHAKGQINQIPVVGNTFYIHQDDARSAYSASNRSFLGKKGCFCSSCGARFAAKRAQGFYALASTDVLKNLKLERTPPNLDDENAFHQFAHDTDVEYLADLTSKIRAYISTKFPGAGKQALFSCNLTGIIADDASSKEVLDQFDFEISEVAPSGHTQRFFWNLGVRSKNYGKKFLTTSNFNFPVPDFRRVVAGTYAVGVNYVVPWDMFLVNPAARGRLFSAKEDYADLYGFIRGIASYLDGYEDAAGWGPDITDARYDATTPPAKIVWGSGKMYAFTRANPKNLQAPVVVHLVDWSDTPKASTVELNISRLFPGRQLLVQLLRPKPYDAALHAGVESSIPKNFDLLVSSVDLPVARVGTDMASVTIPALTPWGVLVVSPVDTTPPGIATNHKPWHSLMNRIRDGRKIPH